jgi:uncharacterized protein (PEP-CTERM system associated)
MIFAAATMRSPSSLAAEWKFTPSIGLRATLSDNVRRTASGEKDPDFYATITPGINIARDGRRLKLNLSYRPSAVLYASSSDQNRWFNSLAAVGNLEAIPNFFFVDATANIAQTFLSPFAPLPIDVGTITENRTETYSASISPYIKGTIGGRTSYQLRYTARYSDSASGAARSATNTSLLGVIGGPLTQRSSWSLQASRQDTKFESRLAYTNSIARLLYTYQVNPDVSVTLRGGYEENNYAFGTTSGVIYGLGAGWAPTPRTEIKGFVENRFFGTGYQLTATHRRRLTAFSLNASRDTSSYPQLLFTLPPGDTRSLLDAALTARITDPAQREAAIDQFLSLTGAPETLNAVTSYYSERINLLERISGSVALLGVRNSVIFSLSWWKSDPISAISGQPLPPELAALNSFTTYGGAVNWSYEVTGRSRLNSLVSRYYTQSNVDPNNKSTNTVARVQLDTNVGPRTTTGIGVRRTSYESTFSTNYIEHAVFAVLNHQF